MSTASPKRIYCPDKGVDVPVWEITTNNGSKIYYERKHYPGFIPIGCNESFKLGKCRVTITDSVRPVKGQGFTIHYIKDGYNVPMSWYAKDNSESKTKKIIEDNDYYPKDVEDVNN